MAADVGCDEKSLLPAGDGKRCAQSMRGHHAPERLSCGWFGAQPHSTHTWVEFAERGCGPEGGKFASRWARLVSPLENALEAPFEEIGPRSLQNPRTRSLARRCRSPRRKLPVICWIDLT